jgi:uncharacterized membrane protein YkoI
MNRHWFWMVAVSVGMLAAAGCASHHHAEKEEGDEVKMKFADVPAPVQKTLTEAAHGAKIDSVDKETDKGQVVYETDVKVNGKTYEIRVAPDGKLISNKEEKDEDEKDEKDEKK